jgi:hypothetical protein
MGYDSRRQILKRKLWTCPQDDCPLYDIREFPHIAWPVVSKQFFLSLGRDITKILFGVGRGALQKIYRGRDIFPPLSHIY